jgi:transcriptional regulator with XRE-family HTH domain
MNETEEQSEPTDDPSHFGATVADILKNRRKELGLTQQDIAAALRIRSPEFIGLVERGSRGLDLNRIPALAAILNVKADRLVETYINEVAPEAYKALVGRTGPTLPLVEDQDVRRLLDLFFRLDETHRQDLLTLLSVWIDERYKGPGNAAP